MAGWKSSVATPPVDDELIQRLQTQQPDALARLYDQYGDRMYGLALRILGNRQEAEDVIQDIFLKLWQQCNYDPKRGSLQSFLMLIVRSRSLDRLRSRKSHLNGVERSGYLNVTDAAKPSPLENITSNEISQRVQDALATLPESQRRALELAYFSGMTQPEIAQHLEVPLGTVKSYFRLGFAKLRQSLQDLIN